MPLTTGGEQLIPEAINQTIYDFYDNFNSGNVTFTPFLTEFNTEAPLCINATVGTGGSISPNGYTIISYGDSYTVNITPNPGYQIADVLVNGTSVGAVNSYNLQTSMESQPFPQVLRPHLFQNFNPAFCSC